MTRHSTRRSPEPTLSELLLFGHPGGVHDDGTPMSTEPPQVLRASGPGSSVLAMVGSGTMVELGYGGFLAADVSVTAELRAECLADVVPVGATVARLAAAWLHAGGRPPGLVDVIARNHRRQGPRATPRLRWSEARLGAIDQVAIGPLRATTILRTGIDLARLESPATARTTLELLVVSAGFDPMLALETLRSRSRVQHAARARTLLASIAEWSVRRKPPPATEHRSADGQSLPSLLSLRPVVR